MTIPMTKTMQGRLSWAGSTSVERPQLWLQLFIALIVTLVLVVLPASEVIRRYERAHWQENLLAHSEHTLDLMEAAIVGDMLAADRGALLYFAEHVAATDHEIARIIILDAAGAQLLDWQASQFVESIPPLSLRHTVENDGKLVGTLLVDWRVDEAQQAMQQQIRGLLLLTTGVLALFSLLIFGWMQHLMLAPLARITRRLNQIAEGDYHISQEHLPSVELNRLNHAVGALADALRLQQEREYDLQHTRDALLQERNLMSTMIDSLPDQIYVKNLDGALIMANRAFLTRWKLDGRTSIVGLKDADFMDAEVAAANSAADEEMMATQQIQLGREVVNQHEGQSTTWVSATRVPLLDQNGAVVGIIGLDRDISERRKLDHLRDDFVANISHELRTPLAAIMGWTETLLSGRPGDLTDKQHHFLDIVYASSQRLNHLIEELLTVSRLQRGALHLSVNSYLPAELLHSVSEALQPMSIAKEIDLEIVHQGEPDQLVTGDVARLEVVLRNLLSNALKFTPAGGKVTVRSDVHDHCWRVTVTDNGIGIPKDEMPHLVKRFFRASTARAAEIQGAGLGLFVCDAFVKAHQGTMTIESQPGEGTTVQVEIPTRFV